MIARHPRLLLVVLCAAFALLQLWAFHWGVITPDSVVQYGQALSGRYDDWHPPVTAWLWRQLHHLGPGGAPFLLLDILLYWAAIGLIADGLRARHGWPAAALPILIALLPVAFGQIGAILKDTLMACLLLLAASLLARRSWGGPGWLALAALPLILIAAATRFNALFAALPLLLLAVPQRWIARPRRYVATATGAVLLLVAGTAAINEAMLRPHHSHPLYSLINFDLGGIVAQGGPSWYPGMTAGRAKALTAHCYDPRLYGARDEEICAEPEDAIAAHAARSGEQPIGLWLNAIITAPGAYVRHRIAHLNWNWRLAVPSVPDDSVYMMSQPNDLGLRFVPNAATRAVVGAARIMAASPLGRPASWIALALGLLVAAPRLPSRRLVTALALSALLYGAGYALISVASDLRYHLWTLLAAMLGLAVTLAERAAISRRRAMLMIAPVLIVAIVEMGALVAG
ncbi:hypothetical protein [Rhizorhabdus sp.]|uniref:hypothetical protein n=1 Tax=Rhizorhabdus sp. TaxID=1968843 RepID=UPI0019CD376E|nr:hypothetical protein [Rhizorhabdus sp.]MBD3760719.1 hypothetical protein [Rhizorhabdus sp.]